MINDNFEEDVLKSEVIGSKEVFENTNNDDNIIEELNDNQTYFTPIVSDGIIEEENLDFREYNQPVENNVLGNEENLEEDLAIEEENIVLNTNDNKVETIDNIDSENASSNENNDLISDKDVEEVLNSNNEQIENSNQLDTENIITDNKDSLLEKYGENFSKKEYICNPAIGRDAEIKELILILLTPEKSGILVGKPGIGKTAIVEGLGYQIQKGTVPDALKNYQIYKLNTASLLGLMPGTDEPKIQVLLNEVKNRENLILFIDEIHTLIGAGADGDDALDFANIFKPGLDRGNIKIIGATTSDEYDRYILTDKAFVRRFQKVEVLEPTKEHTVKIMMGSLPKLEKKTGAVLKYTPFIQEKIMNFIVDLTTEYRRVYELSARYPDIALTILQQAFSYAVFDNKKEVDIRDIRKAISNTKLVYSDVIKKELIRFNEVFSDIYLMETPQRLKGEIAK